MYGLPARIVHVARSVYGGSSKQQTKARRTHHARSCTCPHYRERPTQTSVNALPRTMRPLGKGYKGRGCDEMSGAHEVVRDASPDMCNENVSTLRCTICKYVHPQRSHALICARRMCTQVVRTECDMVSVARATCCRWHTCSQVAMGRYLPFSIVTMPIRAAHYTR